VCVRVRVQRHEYGSDARRRLQQCKYAVCVCVCVCQREGERECVCTHQMCIALCMEFRAVWIKYSYGVATISRLLKIIGLFLQNIVSFIGLFCKRDP